MITAEFSLVVESATGVPRRDTNNPQITQMTVVLAFKVLEPESDDGLVDGNFATLTWKRARLSPSTN